MSERDQAVENPVSSDSALAKRVSELEEANERLLQALSDTSERFTTFMDNSPAVAWIKDSQGRYVYTNRPWEQCFQRDADQWQNKTDYDLWPEDVAQRLRDNDRAVLASGKMIELSEEVPLPGGVHRHWIVYKFPMSNANGERFVGGMAMDISDQRLAEAAVQHSESRMRSIVNTALDAIIEMDAQGRILEWNPQAESIFGWSHDEVIGRELSEIIIPQELRAAHRAGLKKFLDTGEGPLLNTRVEIFALHRDGHQFPVELTIAATTVDNKVTFSGFLRDITERKQTLEAVRQSTLRYESLVNTVDGIVWEADASTFAFTFVSKRAERLLGYPIERWLSDSSFWPEHIHPDDRAWAVQFCQNATAQMRDHEFDYRMIAADGRIVWLHDVVTVVTEDGKPTRLRGIMVNITDRREAVAALKQSEAMLADAQKVAHVGSFTWDIPSQTLTWSDELYRIYGFQPGEFQPSFEAYLKFVHPDDRDSVRQAVENAVAAQKPFSLEERVFRNDGEVRVLATHGEIVCDDAGRAVRMIGTCQDITERKEAETALRKGEEVQRLLFSELDHRVRNNLASLTALVDITARSQTNVRDFARSIRNRVQAMSSVHGLLSREHWTAVDIRSLVEALTPNDVRQRVSMNGPDVLVVPRQATALGMILQELVANSLKYGSLSRTDGHVDIEWSLPDRQDDEAATVKLTWRERGGPPITEKPTASVGSELIEGLCRSELRGEVTLAFPPTGVNHTLTMLLDVPAIA